MLLATNMDRAHISTTSVAHHESTQNDISLTPTQQTSTYFVDNIHCPSCVTHAQEVLLPIAGVHRVDVSIINHKINVQHDIKVATLVTNALLEAAFEVSHITIIDDKGQIIDSYDLESVQSSAQHRRVPVFMSKAQRKHLANCAVCQQDKSNQSLLTRSWLALSNMSRKRKASFGREHSLDLERGQSSSTDSTEKGILDEIVDDEAPDGRHTALVSITGMTCATCTNSVRDALKRLDFIDEVNVNLLANNAKVSFRGPRSNAAKVAEAIEDAGFDAYLDEVHSTETSPKRPAGFDAVFSIAGMTCGSCVATITKGLEAVAGVQSVHVDLLSNSAKVKLTSKDKVDVVLEEIDNLGFDGTLVEIKGDGSDDINDPGYQRTVEYAITGMYCPLCPSNIMNALSGTYGKDLTVLQPPTLQKPRITVKYRPLLHPRLNIRYIKSLIESVDPAIAATVYRPPTVEERSHIIAKKETSRIMRHLLFTFIAAIPSFIIGIVFMSLVKPTDGTRLWLQEPIWVGNAMRQDWIMFLMTTPVMFYGANIFHTRALHEIWSIWRPQSKVPIFRRFYRFGSMNLLISAGTSVAYFSSVAILAMDASMPRMPVGDEMRRSTTYFDTVTFLSLFILAGKWLQAYSKSKTGDAVAMLGKLRPTEALLVETSSLDEDAGKPYIKSIPIDLLELGDVVSIPRGASPPTDGVVSQDGTFLFDESSLTGESRPVRKVQGDTILTGSVNISDPVRVVAKELGGRSMLDQIISVVRDGQSKRAPVERYADTITSYFTPIITLIAITTWTVWLALGYSGALPIAWLDNVEGGWAFWSVEFAIAVFVVACPCGLGLAAPTALFVGGGLAAKAGILVQGGGEAFQEASRINAIVFDKTGTLTEGKMRVTEMVRLDNEADERLMLALTKALEESSTHPIAKAIVQYCEQKLGSPGVSTDNIDLKELSGQGMRGTFTVDGQRYEAAVGNERLISTLDNETAEPVSSNAFLAPELNRLQSTGASTAILAIKPLESSSHWRAAAIFAITDPLRPEAPHVLNKLRQSGIEVHMCTGDNLTTALAIASQLSIPSDRVRANVLPQDKASYIAELQRPASSSTAKPPRRIIAFVGDGTNDTPALTTADVSIALSTGSDIAMTSASFILLNPSLTTILTLVRLAHRVFLRVRLNFAWAAIYNLALVPVAAGVFFPVGHWRLNPVWASAAMAGSSISVVASSLALKFPEISFRRRR